MRPRSSWRSIAFVGALGALLPAPAAFAAPPPAPAAPDASPITVTTRLTPDNPHIGDLMTLRVIAAHPRGYVVNLPTGLDFSPLELVEAEEGGVESTGEGQRKTFYITLQYFGVGEATIPSFPLTYVDPGGAIETLRVPSKSFEVERLLANEADPQRKPEDPPVSLEYPNEKAERIIYMIALGLLAALFGWWASARWRRREQPVVLPPPVPPHVTALESLRTLEDERARMLDAEEHQEYYLRLTEILKTYLEGRFGFDAVDWTTDEIRGYLKRLPETVTPLSATELVRFLADCDLVKFARFAPAKNEAEAALDQVREMVVQSARTPARSAEADGDADGSGGDADGAEGEPKPSSPPENSEEGRA